MEPPMEILIADDDPVTRRLVETLLTRDGYHVTAVESGEAALARLEAADAPPVALLDWMMPGLSGIDVCRRLRAVRPEIPPYVILVTARTRPTEITEGYAAGVNDYVTKPFHREELLVRVRAGAQLVALERRLTSKVAELQEALAQVTQLESLIPICSYCRKVRQDTGYWESVERYLEAVSGARFTHGICPACEARLMGEEEGRTGA